MTKDKWIWMPHAGHFIAASNCSFRLNTYVGGYIVSTIGEYVPRSGVTGGAEFEEIGCDRLYETMVFKSRKSGYKCCPFEMKNCSEIDFKGYKTSKEAMKGHYKLCKKWSK